MGHDLPEALWPRLAEAFIGPQLTSFASPDGSVNGFGRPGAIDMR